MTEDNTRQTTPAGPVIVKYPNDTNTRYGPIREHEPETAVTETPLTAAMRRSAELLDLGSQRLARGPYAASSETEDCLEVTMEEDNGMFESFILQQKRESELKDRDIEEHEWEKVIVGKKKEVQKLVNTINSHSYGNKRRQNSRRNST